MNSKPLITIIVNCYNGQKFINRCIKSILNQTYSNFEVIFWNNKSEDNSLKLIKKFSDKRIKIFNTKIHSNLSVARNKAIKKSLGDFICFLDIDDYWSKKKLEYQIKSFDKKDIGFSFTNFWYLSEYKNFKSKKKINLEFNEGLINKIIKKYEIVLSTIMVKKKLLQKIKKPFNEKYHIISDLDFTLKLLSITKFYHIKNHLTYRTWHGENESIKKREQSVFEMKDWINKNMLNYKKYYKEIIFVKKKIFIDQLNFKIKKKKILEAIIIFLKSELSFKLSYIKYFIIRFVLSIKIS